MFWGGWPPPCNDDGSVEFPGPVFKGLSGWVTGLILEQDDAAEDCLHTHHQIARRTTSSFGFHPGNCGQIEELSEPLLNASTLRSHRGWMGVLMPAPTQ
ncbi:uncharacterized protein EI90DRAFT_2692659 [Cantharellus anzutake]|uniref:uncharacterized protein n=1 Tax=Cantharellus anzutake TaxID=1750568 RepID=UPI00190424DF|nr:uncharacterized protein EI90DRAFT_2692659 [Cantharellus anzutake]KAF8318935.1 hypothetical protein EI90DRAFT_2692659 [Cantharellus anzutake]